MKTRLAYIANRVLIISATIMLANLLFTHYFYPARLQKDGWLKSLAERGYAEKSDILYLSSSVNSSFAENDSDKRTIDELIQTHFKTTSISSIDTGALHAGIFSFVLKNLPSNYQPKMIVVDLNLRSFGLDWIQSPLENSLQRNLVYWNESPGLVNQWKAALKMYNFVPNPERKRIIEYNNSFIKLPLSNKTRTVREWQMKLEKTSKSPVNSKQFVSLFGFTIDEKNEMLKNYDELISVAKAKNIPVLFLLLPEKVEAMQRFVGTDLVRLVHQNADFLKNHFQAKAKIIDLSDHFDDSYYFETFPTEHYREKGRKVIADTVAFEIKKWKKWN